MGTVRAEQLDADANWCLQRNSEVTTQLLTAQIFKKKQQKNCVFVNMD